jgi:hypothetical protein
MNANPFLGVFLHWLGGLASGSFYVPYKGVKRWSWETYWLAGGFFSWIIAPWILAFVMTPDLLQVLGGQPAKTLFWTYFWGAMWGLGGLTFGLTMRYLGMSLGMAIALGYCAAFGTLMPPLFAGTLGDKLSSVPGIVILIGCVICLQGIVIAGMAGMSKERELPEEQKKAAIQEFNFWKGILVATFSGVMSASMSYGLDAAAPIKAAALQSNLLRSAKADGLAVQAQPPVDRAEALKLSELLYRSDDPAVKPLKKQAKRPADIDVANLVKAVEGGPPGEVEALVRCLGATSNPVAARIVTYAGCYARLPASDPEKKGTDARKVLSGYAELELKQVAADIALAGGDVVKYHGRHGLWRGLPALVAVLLGGFTSNFIWCLLLLLKNRTLHQYASPVTRDASGGEPAGQRVPLLSNYLFSALAGTTWYMQFFFYTMGETQMGDYGFASWTLHMASIIIFSSLWGIGLREWKGSSRFTKFLLGLGLFTLVASTVVIGYGTKVEQDLKESRPAAVVTAPAAEPAK